VISDFHSRLRLEERWFVKSPSEARCHLLESALPPIWVGRKPDYARSFVAAKTCAVTNPNFGRAAVCEGGLDAANAWQHDCSSAAGLSRARDAAARTHGSNPARLCQVCRCTLGAPRFSPTIAGRFSLITPASPLPEKSRDFRFTEQKICVIGVICGSIKQICVICG
jgi:hypothetical protein